jgi:hypothetical protein
LAAPAFTQPACCSNRLAHFAGRTANTGWISQSAAVAHQIFSTALSLAMVYIPGGARSHLVHVLTQDHDMFQPG